MGKLNKFLACLVGWVFWTPWVLYSSEYLMELSLEERRSVMGEMWFLVAATFTIGLVLLYATVKTLISEPEEKDEE